MSDMTSTPRRRSLWGLLFMPVLVFLAAVAWSGFWYYAASQVGVQADAWRAQEAKAGRVYDCGKRSVAGYPFRLEIRCEDPSVTLISQTASPQTSFTGRLGEILVVAQVYDPKLVIAEFRAPATLAERGAPPSLSINWSKGRSSVVGLPAVPQRASLVFDDLAIDRIGGATPIALARAGHVELHGRQVDGPAPDSPAIETALQIAGGSLQDVHPLLAQPFNADIRARLTGLKDLSPKPWPERFREIQAAGGSVEIVQSRIEQGDLVSVAAGALRLNANGRIDGELQMTVAGIERVIPALGIDKMLEEGVPQATLDRVAPGVKTQDIGNLFGALDRMIPGLGKTIKQNANAGVAAGINSLGTEAVLEGKKARAFPLRFVDGGVFLGPLKVGQVPPLF
ncbi:DUF2125 domain-containing protein [Bradyrhizobium lablabi]|uniref:DUF2125 domain-containing protein n=1 Tax=Bradyrhizobium lablabi TaxID=722472 RepID=UPI001BAAA40A|nr:DUF2125 domain-containing protein [Bradyrhizobium lablabi]MBR0691708.1 DUF2125 domain-containing protein [Bradyrhizobium lablabi]